MGLISTVTSPAHTVLGQVTKADSSITGFDRAYEYDAIGNRKKAANSLTLPTSDNYTSNALNQYTAIGTIAPTYDADGNATAYPVPTRLTANSSLSWDAENRMRSATVNGVTTTYLYDAGSRRIAQTTGTTTTVYIYDAWNPIAEYTGTTLAKTYTWGTDLSGSLQGAGGVGGLLAVTQATTSHFPTYDGNGNVSEYLTAAGTTAAHYEYDPFGRTTTTTGTLATSFAHRFSTKPVDGPTGFYYYGYRYMDPVTGRWPSRDPIGFGGGLNLYGFVNNQTAAILDLLGLALWPADGGEITAKGMSVLNPGLALVTSETFVPEYLDVSSDSPTFSVNNDRFRLGQRTKYYASSKWEKLKPRKADESRTIVRLEDGKCACQSFEGDVYKRVVAELIYDVTIEADLQYKQELLGQVANWSIPKLPWLASFALDIAGYYAGGHVKAGDMKISGTPDPKWQIILFDFYYDSQARFFCYC